MKTILAILCSALLCSCATPTIRGGTAEAVKARSERSADILDRVAPEGCTFDRYKNVYNCDAGVDPSKINKRVFRTRENIIEILAGRRSGTFSGRPDSSILNLDKLGLTIIEDLYYCRDNNGIRIVEKSSVMYCETKIPPIVIDEFEKNGITHYISVYNGLYKYMTAKK